MRVPSMSRRGIVKVAAVGACLVLWRARPVDAMEIKMANDVPGIRFDFQSTGIEGWSAVIHNHGLADTPRLSYTHFWANDDPAKLAQGLEAALDQTNRKTL